MIDQPESRSRRARSWPRRVFRLCLVCLLTSLIFLAALKMFIIYEAHKIKAIARALQTLTPGVSSRKDAERIARGFGGRTDLHGQPCTQDACTFRMTVRWFDPPFVGRRRLWDDIMQQSYALLDSRYLNAIGIHMWDSQAWIDLRRNVVSSYGLHVYVEGADHAWTDAGWSLYEEIPEELLSLHDNKLLPGSRNYLTGWHHLHMGRETGQGLNAYVRVQSPREYIQHAQDLNLTCLTKWGGCLNLYELYPEAARDHDRFVSCELENRLGKATFPCE
jgi:hypothetical protein